MQERSIAASENSVQRLAGSHESKHDRWMIAIGLLFRMLCDRFGSPQAGRQLTTISD
jgi:hypothetical protein